MRMRTLTPAGCLMAVFLLLCVLLAVITFMSAGAP